MFELRNYQHILGHKWYRAAGWEINANMMGKDTRCSAPSSGCIVKQQNVKDAWEYLVSGYAFIILFSIFYIDFGVNVRSGRWKHVCQLSYDMANTECTQRLFRLTVMTAITHGNMVVSNNNRSLSTDKEAKIFIF